MVVLLYIFNPINTFTKNVCIVCCSSNVALRGSKDLTITITLSQRYQIRKRLVVLLKRLSVLNTRNGYPKQFVS